jgi:hypothetical protein
MTTQQKTPVKMSYNEKKRIADRYLFNSFGLCWDDLGDINSLHDTETEQDIIEFCDERIQDV